MLQNGTEVSTKPHPLPGLSIPEHPILDSIADGVFTVDNLGQITSFNRAAQEITGFSRAEAIGRRCSEVFRASICQGDCALRRTIDTGQRLVNIPVEIQNRDGRAIPISISTAVLYDAEGTRIGGVETFRDLTALTELRREIDERNELSEIVGRHPRMQEVLEIIPEISASDATVLIQGASGTGKGLLARAIHNLSRRHDKPFVKVNCAALPETLLESELFGYVKGAFTDARRDHPGRIAVAEGGTLFLDEIGDVPPSVQVKLLRVVQEREYEALGSSTTRVANVRVVAATNRDLVRLMEENRFREDLYYRLNIVGLELPRLAERREDIPRLVDRFLHQFCQKMGKHVAGVTEGAMGLLTTHDYPGNVRELENAIEHAMVLCRGSMIEDRHLPNTIRDGQQARATPVDPLESAESRVLQETLERHGGNRNEAARELGLHRTTLWRKMRRYGLA